MKGLELCEKFYNEYGKNLINTLFPEYADKIAVGLVGEGSECLGFDDQTSVDHDFDAGFCLFIPERLEREIGFKLERAYAKLPKEFMGVKRQMLSPADGNRKGVMTIEGFYQKTIGSSLPPQNIYQWFNIPPHALLNATNGKVFRDDSGEFTEIRNQLQKGYPLDVKKKKLASHTILMAQSGQYNYARCIEHGETGAAGLALFEFVKHTISVIYLLNDAFEPYYKWVYKGMRNLKKLSELEFTLSGLTETGNGKKQAGEKLEIIEDVAKMIIDEFKAQNLTSATCNNLETHAYSITNKISDAQIRNMNIFSGI